MKSFNINKKLKNIYAHYYNNSIFQWRGIGAIDKANNILELCKSIPHNCILDIGSGEGAVIQRLSDLKFAKEIFSLEISSFAIKSIKNRKIKNLKNVSLFDGYNISYGDKIFDLAILSHVIEHVEYPRKLLYEAGRVAKYVFIEVPLELNIRLREAYVVKNPVYHINFYSPKTIHFLLISSGFKILSQKVINSSYSGYQYLYGKRAFLHYLIKEMALYISPTFATTVFTYNCALLVGSIKTPQNDRN